jgi:hypothetical protein
VVACAGALTDLHPSEHLTAAVGDAAFVSTTGRPSTTATRAVGSPALGGSPESNVVSPTEPSVTDTLHTTG